MCLPSHFSSRFFARIYLVFLALFSAPPCPVLVFHFTDCLAAFVRIRIRHLLASILDFLLALIALTSLPVPRSSSSLLSTSISTILSAFRSKTASLRLKSEARPRTLLLIYNRAFISLSAVRGTVHPRQGDHTVFGLPPGKGVPIDDKAHVISPASRASPFHRYMARARRFLKPPSQYSRRV